ncbi:HNH endonuclease signature motif containing protein [Streptomyces sp. NPDC040724]|uniref:HNH endonuclease signature motif containing protein n=1 Tax=Streptomyces sp. NPDC040724 TaxID=3155612 RepID=UPI0034036D49
MCAEVLVLPSPRHRYSEATHIRAREDNGPDIVENLLCLCPTCHVLFDAGALHRLPVRSPPPPALGWQRPAAARKRAVGAPQALRPSIDAHPLGPWPGTTVRPHSPTTKIRASCGPAPAHRRQIPSFCLVRSDAARVPPALEEPLLQLFPEGSWVLLERQVELPEGKLPSRSQLRSVTHRH